MEESSSIQNYMTAIITSAVTLSLVGAVVAFYIYRRFFCHTYFKRLGVSGPTPHWLFGNMLDFADDSRRHLLLMEWAKKYGKLYGFYEGPTPVLVVSDFEMVKQVCVKQFDTFNSHKEFPLVPNSDEDELNTNLFLYRGAKWRRLRHALNPAFSTGNLRKMAPVMFKTIKRLVDVIEESGRQGVDIEVYDKYKELAGKVILESAFGIDMDELEKVGRAKEVYENMQNCFYEESHPKPIFIMDLIMPEFDPLFRIISFMQEHLYGFRASSRFVMNLAKVMMEKRQTDPSSRRADLLQLMVDTAEKSEAEAAEAKLMGDDEPASGMLSNRRMSSDEIQAQSVLFMVAGFETSSTTLAFATYLLGLNPECQEKLYESVMKHVKFDETGFPDPESLTECEYLDWVVKEALRIYPVAAPVMTRVAQEKTTLNGLEIPKGLTIQIDAMTIHRNMELWGPEDPEKFYPERFSPSYPRNSDMEVPVLSFGYGSRKCIGARFADLEIKIAISMLVRRVKITQCESTQVPLVLKVGMTMVPRDGVHLRMVPRTNVTA